MAKTKRQAGPGERGHLAGLEGTPLGAVYEKSLKVDEEQKKAEESEAERKEDQLKREKILAALQENREEIEFLYSRRKAS